MTESTYTITGMTCQNCAKKSESLLSTDKRVQRVVINLEEKTARISSTGTPALEELNALLVGTKYKLSLRKDIENTVNVKAYRMIKKFFPLACMFTLVGGITAAYAAIYESDIHRILEVLMGTYFFAFGALKVVDLKKFARTYSTYDDLARTVPMWSFLYPFVELTLGFLFWTGHSLVFANVATVLMMTQKSVSVFRKIRSGESVTCACLGGFFTIPVTWVTFSEDVFMALMSLGMLALYL